MSTYKKFKEISDALPGCKSGKMFGAECIKSSNNGKALAFYYKEHMVFKLKDEAYDDAMSLDGTDLFNPTGTRPMGGWVQVPEDYMNKWDTFAEAAREYVASLPENKKKK